MKFFRMFTLVAVALSSLVFCGCSAFRRDGRTQAQTLIVTGNILKPRLICELAQLRTKQPMVLISPDVDGSYQLFLLGAPEKAPEPVFKEKFAELVSFINPRRVIFVGGEDIIPSELIAQSKTVAPTMVLCGDDWSAVAKELGNFLGHKRLQREYDDYMSRLDKVGLGDSKNK